MSIVSLWQRFIVPGEAYVGTAALGCPVERISTGFFTTFANTKDRSAGKTSQGIDNFNSGQRDVASNVSTV
jgi:hypothetical protein